MNLTRKESQALMVISKYVLENIECTIESATCPILKDVTLENLKEAKRQNRGKLEYPGIVDAEKAYRALKVLGMISVGREHGTKM